MIDKCDICAQEYTTRRASEAEPYRYTEGGLGHVYLAGVNVFACPRCRAETAAIPDINGLHSLVAELLLAPGAMLGGREFRFIRKEAAIGVASLAAWARIGQRTITDFEDADTPPPSPVLCLFADKAWRRAEARWTPCDRCGRPKTRTTDAGGSLWHSCDECSPAPLSTR